MAQISWNQLIENRFSCRETNKLNVVNHKHDLCQCHFAWFKCDFLIPLSICHWQIVADTIFQLPPKVTKQNKEKFIHFNTIALKWRCGPARNFIHYHNGTMIGCAFPCEINAVGTLQMSQLSLSSTCVESFAIAKIDSQSILFTVRTAGKWISSVICSRYWFYGARITLDSKCAPQISHTCIFNSPMMWFFIKVNGTCFSFYTIFLKVWPI